MLNDLYRANAEDMGHEMQGKSGQFDAPPASALPLMMEGEMPELKPLTDEDRALIQWQRRSVKRMSEAPYFLVDEKKVPEIVRWSDLRLRNKSQGTLVQELAKSAKCAPPELLVEHDSGAHAGGRCSSYQ